MQPIEVGVLGGTGMVGQHFVKFLQGHPWFKLTWIGASDRSAGKKYRDATSWRLEGGMPADVADLDVSESKPDASAPSTKNFMAASVAATDSRLIATIAYCDRDSSSSPR